MNKTVNRNPHLEAWPLFGFFNRLRKVPGCSMGLEEYFVLLRHAEDIRLLNEYYLQLGKENAQPIDLYTVCKKLWLKPGLNPAIFQRLWDEYFQELHQAVQRSEASGQLRPASMDNEQNRKPALDLDRPKHTNDPVAQPENNPLTDQPPLEATPSEQTDWEVGDAYIEIKKTTNPNEEYVEKDINTRFYFRFLTQYYPLPSRNLQQSWRALRIYRRGNRYSSEIDINATVQNMLTKGFLENIDYHPNRENKARLLVMVDHKGSMVAFGRLTQLLIETAAIGTEMPCIVYYFLNLPRRSVFLNRSHTRFEALHSVIDRESAHNSSVLIISDAGAARGGLNESRIDATEEWLNKLREISHKIAWINPMPRDRWQHTSADYIKSLVPMYDATEDGLRHAVRILRGKTPVFI